MVEEDGGPILLTLQHGDGSCISVVLGPAEAVAIAADLLNGQACGW
jgi:hypothetical protein